MRSPKHIFDASDRICRVCAGRGTEPDPAAIGETLRRRREHEGVSLRKLADRLEVSPPYLSDLERGQRRWSLRRIEQYVEALDVMGRVA